MGIKIVPYNSTYYKSCINIIQSNTPKFIDESEHADFESYLARDNKTYFIVLKDDKPIGCGGYGLNESKTKAGLSWGLIHRDYHQCGYGGELLKFRIDHIQSNFPNVEIQLDTSQYTYQFFEKYGFKLLEIETDGWAEGLYKYHMVLI